MSDCRVRRFTEYLRISMPGLTSCSFFPRFLAGAAALTLIAQSAPASVICAPDSQYIREWLVAGPLDVPLDTFGDGPNQISLKDLSPQEGDILTDAQGHNTAWRAYRAQDALVDFAPLLQGRPPGVFAAFCQISCQEASEVELWITHGAEMPLALYAAGAWRRCAEGPSELMMDNVCIPLSLRAGENPLFVLGFCSGPIGRFGLRASDHGAPGPAMPSKLLRKGAIAGCFLHPPAVRFRIGDDPAWSLPAADDADWDSYAPAVNQPICRAAGKESDVIWYRFRLRFSSGYVDTPLVLTMLPYDGASDIFADGFPLGSPQYIHPPWPDLPRPWFPQHEEVTVAVRWDRSRASQDTRNAGIQLSLRGFQNALHAYASGNVKESRYSLHRILLMTIFGVLLIFHTTMSFYLPKRREYRWFSLTLAACFLAILSLHISDRTCLQYIWIIAYGKAFSGFTILSVLFGLGLVQIIMTGRIACTFYLYAALAVAVYWVALQNIDYTFYFPMLALPEMIRVQYLALRARRPGIMLFLAFTVFLLTLMLFHALGTIYDWPETTGFARYSSWYGFAVFALLVALLLARDFASANRQLEHFADDLDLKVKQRTSELELALANVKTLSGLLPICSSCKKIRDDSGYWRQIEAYISSHSEAHFTHGICPECAERLYPTVQKSSDKKS